MGLKVVAEGVETQEGWNLLRRLGCDLIQGYLISRPLSPADTVNFLRQTNGSEPVERIGPTPLRGTTAGRSP